MHDGESTIQVNTIIQTLTLYVGFNKQPAGSNLRKQDKQKLKLLVGQMRKKKGYEIHELILQQQLYRQITETSQQAQIEP